MTNFDEYKTEIIGISTEIGIADYYGVPIDSKYRLRGNDNLIEVVKAAIALLEEDFKFPKPTKHIAEKQNPVDFLLQNQATLSVKTNKSNSNKVAPQIIGQPTANTYFNYFERILNIETPDNRNDKIKLFKELSIKNIDVIMEHYWNNLFHCDYMIYMFDFLNKDGSLKELPTYVGFTKLESPLWEKEKFSFTQSIESWNESNTVKYNNVTIGEFQVHNNRDTFKFRFNIRNLYNSIIKDLIETD